MVLLLLETLQNEREDHCPASLAPCWRGSLMLPFWYYAPKTSKDWTLQFSARQTLAFPSLRTQKDHLPFWLWVAEVLRKPWSSRIKTILPSPSIIQKRGMVIVCKRWLHYHGQPKFVNLSLPMRYGGGGERERELFEAMQRVS